MKNLYLLLLFLLNFICYSGMALSKQINPFMIEVWADNWFTAYLDGKFLVEDSIPITTERSFNAEKQQFSASYPFELAFIIKDFKENNTGLEYIGTARQQIGDGGFIMQITDQVSGKVVGFSDNTMRCEVIHKAPLDKSCVNEQNPIAGEKSCSFLSLNEPKGWKTNTFNDSLWQTATVYSKHQVKPKKGFNKIRWNKQAKLIWTSDLETDNTILCRITIDNHNKEKDFKKDLNKNIYSHFNYFPNIRTSSDDKYFYVASNGMPEHNMMKSISSWQQQVPIPQNYTGNNSWSVPLHPVLAEKPILTKNHFHRGAVAIAVNGVPIFNALNNRGEYAADVGELDEWGGHSGRADDYHYHLAPEHLESVVGKSNPIAYALDGFPLYGKTDSKLDEYLGRFNTQGSYQYHAVDYQPYFIAGLRGKVNSDSLFNAPEDQIIPQPRTRPLRPGNYGPLNGAKITGFTKTSLNSYSLEFSLNNRIQKLNYSWDKNGIYKFVFIDENGKQNTQIFQKNTRNHKINNTRFNQPNRTINYNGNNAKFNKLMAKRLTKIPYDLYSNCLKYAKDNRSSKDCCDCLPVNERIRKICRDATNNYNFSKNNKIETFDILSLLGVNGDYSACSSSGNKDECKKCCDSSKQYACGDFKYCRSACNQLPSNNNQSNRFQNNNQRRYCGDGICDHTESANWCFVDCGN